MIETIEVPDSKIHYLKRNHKVTIFKEILKCKPFGGKYGELIVYDNKLYYIKALVRNTENMFKAHIALIGSIVKED